jgi:hypothetical protein
MSGFLIMVSRPEKVDYKVNKNATGKDWIKRRLPNAEIQRVFQEANCPGI